VATARAGPWAIARSKPSPSFLPTVASAASKMPPSASPSCAGTLLIARHVRPHLHLPQLGEKSQGVDQRRSIQHCRNVTIAVTIRCCSVRPTASLGRGRVLEFKELRPHAPRSSELTSRRPQVRALHRPPLSLFSFSTAERREESDLLRSGRIVRRIVKLSESPRSLPSATSYKARGLQSRARSRSRSRSAQRA